VERKRLKVSLERDQEGLWAGWVQDLPVFSWGKRSKEEVLESLKEGVYLYLEEIGEEREEIELVEENEVDGF